MTEIQLWKPVRFDEETWGRADTTKFDRIAPSWAEYRKKLNADQGEYARFLQTLKYEHAIETGIVERLYEIADDKIRGITETLLKSGINSSFLQHGDAEYPESAMALIRDQYEAIDGVFSFIKNERPISTSFIKELHVAVTRSQEYTEAVTPSGSYVRVPFLKGKYKEQDNNPRRPDGVIIKYCPPLDVSPEMDSLINIYESLAERNAHVIVRAAFFHHAMSAVHPFQDGNGRVTRLLTSLILIREGYFPFSVKRSERGGYLDALEQADAGVVQPFVDFVSACQVRDIESALNLRIGYDTLDAIAGAIKDKIRVGEERERKKHEAFVTKAERSIEIKSIINKHAQIMRDTVCQKIGLDVEYIYGERGDLFVDLHYPKRFYAENYGCSMKNNLALFWSGLGFTALGQRFRIIVFPEHFGQNDDAIAIGGALVTEAQIIPLDIQPLCLSVLTDINETTKRDIKDHVERLITVAMAAIASEI